MPWGITPDRSFLKSMSTEELEVRLFHDSKETQFCFLSGATGASHASKPGSERHRERDRERQRERSLEREERERPHTAADKEQQARLLSVLYAAEPLHKAPIQAHTASTADKSDQNVIQYSLADEIIQTTRAPSRSLEQLAASPFVLPTSLSISPPVSPLERVASVTSVEHEVQPSSTLWRQHGHLHLR